MASNKSTSSDSDEEYFDAEEQSSFADNDATSSSMSLTIGSDEVQEMFCEECEKHENIYVPAEGFCVECVEYKCAMCIKFHRRYHQNHPLQDKDSMPQDFYFEKCTKHPKEMIKFYCGKCEKVACPECKRNDHLNCCNVKHLPTLVKNVERSKQLKDIKENLDKVSEDIENITTQIKSKTEIASNLKSEAKATIKKHKDKLINAYRQHQKKIIKQFDKKMEETIAKLKSERIKLIELTDQKKTKFEQNIMLSENNTVQKMETSQTNLESLEKKNSTLTSDLKQLSADLTQAEVTGQKCNLFLAMKDAQETLKNFKKQILHLRSTDIQHYIIEPLNTELSVKTLESQTTFFSFDNSITERIAPFDKEINSKCEINSFLCLLSENILVQTDWNRNCLKILKNFYTNTESYYSIKMPSGACGITKVKDNKVAITFPNIGIVRLITFSDSMTIISTDDIKVGAGCLGIAYSNNNLIVSYDTNPGKVQILDMSGNVLKCFDKDSDGQSLLSLPRYLTLSPDNKTIYVSDFNRNTVTSMTMDGKVKAIYRDDQLGGPRQMTVDESGTVYVCGFWSDNVHQLTSDLTKVKILLDTRQGMHNPVSVAYCQKNSRLYVRMHRNNIKVFNISSK